MLHPAQLILAQMIPKRLFRVSREFKQDSKGRHWSTSLTSLFIEFDSFTRDCTPVACARPQFGPIWQSVAVCWRWITSVLVAVYIIIIIIIQLYFQPQGPLARNRQYKPKRYTLKKTIMPILPHRGLISHFSKPRICQQHYNIIMWIVQPTNKFIYQISH